MKISRLLTSFYEALNITAQLDCAKKGMDFFPLWFLFAIVAMNILLVNYQMCRQHHFLFTGDKRIFEHSDLHICWQLLPRAIAQDLPRLQRDKPFPKVTMS